MAASVVLITGALDGIGRAAAFAFARDRAHLVVSGRRIEAGAKLAAELKALGADALFVPADVRQEDEVKALVDTAVARFGRIDVAVNSAGTEGPPGFLTGQSAQTYANVFDTNVLGTLLAMKYELLAMQPLKRGSIINLSSSMGHKAAPGAALYIASKHALEGLTKAAALEAAPFGVRVNAVAPGPIETAMLNRFTPERKAMLIGGVPLKRAGEADEVARAVRFLASDDASFVTGHIFAVDGGKSAG